MPCTPAAATAALMSSIAKGFTTAVTSFIAPSALRGRATRGGIRIDEGSIESASDHGFVGVGLFLVDPDVAEFQDLVGCAQLHEQAEDSENRERDEPVPDDDRERGAELDQDLYGVMAPQPARGGDVGYILAVAWGENDGRGGQHPAQQSAGRAGHTAALPHADWCVVLLDKP